MKRVLLASLGLVLGLTLPVAAAIPPRATLAIVAPVVQSHHRANYGASCFPMRFSPMRQIGAWVVVGATCRDNQDATFVDYLHWNGFAWTFACGHGDDIMPINYAMHRCGMTRAIALSFGHLWHGQIYL